MFIRVELQARLGPSPELDGPGALVISIFSGCLFFSVSVGSNVITTSFLVFSLLHLLHFCLSK